MFSNNQCIFIYEQQQIITCYKYNITKQHRIRLENFDEYRNRKLKDVL